MKRTKIRKLKKARFIRSTYSSWPVGASLVAVVANKSPSLIESGKSSRQRWKGSVDAKKQKRRVAKPL